MIIEKQKITGSVWYILYSLQVAKKCFGDSLKVTLLLEKEFDLIYKLKSGIDEAIKVLYKYARNPESEEIFAMAYVKYIQSRSRVINEKDLEKEQTNHHKSKIDEQFVPN